MTLRYAVGRFGHAELGAMLRVAAEEADRADALVGSASALSHYQTNTDADEVLAIVIIMDSSAQMILL